MNEEELNPQFQGRVITFIKYLFYFPITEKISVPNYKTFLWLGLLISTFFKYLWITLFLLGLLLIIYLIDEYQSKRYIDWYRSKKYKLHKEAIKKVRQERKLKEADLYSSGDEKKKEEGGSEKSPNPQL